MVCLNSDEYGEEDNVSLEILGEYFEGQQKINVLITHQG